jgi:hypothetical protein
MSLPLWGQTSPKANACARLGVKGTFFLHALMSANDTSMSSFADDAT